MRFEEIEKKVSIILIKYFLFWLILFFSLALLATLFIWENLSQKKEIKIEKEKIIEFDQKSFEKFLEIWQNRKERLKRIEQKEYKNPFLD